MYREPLQVLRTRLFGIIYFMMHPHCFSKYHNAMYDALWLPMLCLGMRHEVSRRSINTFNVRDWRSTDDMLEQ